MFVYQESFKLAFKTGFCFHIFDIYTKDIYFTGYFNCDKIYFSCGNDIGALLNC